jgi:hypothetical protein
LAIASPSEHTRRGEDSRTLDYLARIAPAKCSVCACAFESGARFTLPTIVIDVLAFRAAYRIGKFAKRNEI